MLLFVSCNHACCELLLRVPACPPPTATPTSTLCLHAGDVTTTDNSLLAKVSSLATARGGNNFDVHGHVDVSALWPVDGPQHEDGSAERHNKHVNGRPRSSWRHDDNNNGGQDDQAAQDSSRPSDDGASAEPAAPGGTSSTPADTTGSSSSPADTGSTSNNGVPAACPFQSVLAHLAASCTHAPTVLPAPLNSCHTLKHTIAHMHTQSSRRCLPNTMPTASATAWLP